jgi:hypothetical protein
MTLALLLVLAAAAAAGQQVLVTRTAQFKVRVCVELFV